MNITLANYQLAAIAKLNEGMASDKRDIVLKSCTGSGKTVILTHFMSEYCRSHGNTVFVWLTPGKGNGNGNCLSYIISFGEIHKIAVREHLFIHY